MLCFTSGDESLSSRLRTHCAWELENNKEQYFNHPHLTKCAEKSNIPANILIHYLLGDDAVSKGDSKTAYEYEVNQTFIKNRWCSMLHVLAMSTVFQRDIVSVYPDVPLPHRSLIHCVVTPLRKDTGIKLSKEALDQPIIILWTRDGAFDTSHSAIYSPNHVVPLIEKDRISNVSRNAKQRGASNTCVSNKQGKISLFFKPLSKKHQKNSPSDEQHQAEKLAEQPPTNISEPTEPVAKRVKTQTNGGKPEELLTKRLPNHVMSWLAQFDWLQCDQRELKCKLCVASGKTNVFTAGKQIDVAKRDDLVKHEKSKDHRFSKDVPVLQSHMTKAVSKANESVKDAIIAQMATALTQAQEAIPTNKNSKLVKLQIFNVSQSPV